MTIYAPSLSWVIDAVEKGADLNEYDYADMSQYGLTTPLGCALRNSRVDIFKYLIRRGADINKIMFKQGNGDTTLLWYAAEKRKYRFVELLLNHGAERTSNEGSSLLTYSISRPDLELFNCLIKNGDDVNEVDERGWTPLLTAVKSRKIEMIKTLLDYGAEFSLQNAFIEAIAIEELAITELLIERGADVNFQSVTGFTPLTKATKNGSLQIVEILIKNGAEVNVLDSGGNSPLVNSCRIAQLDLIKLLVENGANIQQADDHGNLPILEAMNTKNFPIISFLIENGAKWNNIRDNAGYSPLTLSVLKRNFDMLKFFLDRKVDVNEPDDNQKVALVLAVETSNVRFAKMLTEHGALVDDVIEQIEQLASSDDNWKKFFVEVQAERKILKHSLPVTMEGDQGHSMSN